MNVRFGSNLQSLYAKADSRVRNLTTYVSSTSSDYGNARASDAGSCLDSIKTGLKAQNAVLMALLDRLEQISAFQENLPALRHQRAEEACGEQGLFRRLELDLQG